MRRISAVFLVCTQYYLAANVVQEPIAAAKPFSARRNHFIYYIKINKEKNRKEFICLTGRVGVQTTANLGDHHCPPQNEQIQHEEGEQERDKAHKAVLFHKEFSVYTLQIIELFGFRKEQFEDQTKHRE